MSNYSALDNFIQSRYLIYITKSGAMAEKIPPHPQFFIAILYTIIVLAKDMLLITASTFCPNLLAILFSPTETPRVLK